MTDCDHNGSPNKRTPNDQPSTRPLEIFGIILALLYMVGWVWVIVNDKL